MRPGQCSNTSRTIELLTVASIIQEPDVLQNPNVHWVWVLMDIPLAVSHGDSRDEREGKTFQKTHTCHGLTALNKLRQL